MSDIAETAGQAAVKPSLGIGALLTDTFRLYFRRFFYFFGVSLLGLIAVYIIAFAALAPFFASQFQIDEAPNATLSGGLAAVIPFIVIVGLGYIFLAAVIVRSAITVKLHDRVEFGSALSAAVRGLIPLALIGLVMVVPLYLGFLLLLIPGLYLVAMLYALTPAVVFERRGFGGLVRSFQLTSGYRWAIMGFFVALGILTFLIALICSMVFGGLGLGLMFAASQAGDEVLGVILYGVTSILNLLATAATTPLSFIAIAIAYARLREIKEGGGDELLRVFE
jgi:hypothetical protein